MFHRLARLPIAFIVVLLLASGSGARAQETDTSLLTAAVEQTRAASGYQFSFTLRVDLTGIPGSEIALGLNGSGVVARRDDGPAIDLTLNGSGHIAGRQAPTGVRARVLDGTFYFNLPGSDRWTGGRLDELIPLLEDIYVGDFIRGFTSRADLPLTAGPPTVGNTDDARVKAALDAVVETLARLDVSRYAAVQRLPDEPVDGAQTAHFVTDVAVSDLVRSDEALGLLVNLVRIGNPAQPELSETERAAVGTLFARIFGQTRLTLDQYVGLDDGYLHRWSAHLDALIDPASFDGTGSAVHLGVDFDARLGEFNGGQLVDVPPRSIVISGLADALGLNRTTVVSPPFQPTALPVALVGAPIAAGAPTSVQIASGAPADLIYTAQAGETISVVARSLEQPGSLDPEVTVLDAGNVQLAQNDDHTGSRPNLQPFDSVVEGLSLPAAGQYLIRVNTLSAAAQGRVEVTVESVAPPTPTVPAPTATVPPTSTPIPPTATLPPTPTSTPTATATLAPPQILRLSDRVPEQGSYSYDFGATAGQVVTITVHATGDLDPKALLLGADGTTLAQNDDHEDADAALNGYDARIRDFAIPLDGSYRVEILGFAATGGPFDLIVEITTPAQPVIAPTEIAGPLNHQDVDGSVGVGQPFTTVLDAQAGDVYTFTAISTSGDLDTVLDVLDAGGNVVTSGDNHGSSDPALSSTDARIDNFIFQRAGTYTLHVSGARDTSGGFTLSIDRIATGAPLGGGQDQVSTGQVEPNNLFNTPFEAQAGDYVTITVRTLTGGLDPQVTLLDAGGAVLADNDDHGMADATLSQVDARINNFRIPASGTYTIQVAGYNNTGGSFALAITTLR